jgi:hypothetical protein
MRVPGDIGWKKYHKLMRDSARRSYYAWHRTPRHSSFLRSLGESIERPRG